MSEDMTKKDRVERMVCFMVGGIEANGNAENEAPPKTIVINAIAYVEAIDEAFEKKADPNKPEPF